MSKTSDKFYEFTSLLPVSNNQISLTLQLLVIKVINFEYIKNTTLNFKAITKLSYKGSL
jgi:hypothetical protein